MHCTGKNSLNGTEGAPQLTIPRNIIHSSGRKSSACACFSRVFLEGFPLARKKRSMPGVGENWLARAVGRWSPFPGPPPLGSRDGGLKKVIDGGKEI